ncbi:hypothetical protein HPL003_13055 [Paenibacillus terrae HPL-003]|uniref:Uncharacterized protein n=1 Tax=Paenibacillus terrae (strain HPL-003) TaxID=985665 RepID=G7VWG3_PAETH|nr:hypothetical protein HPL003_13055 [Paenibacillus terrae HPL-003]
MGNFQIWVIGMIIFIFLLQKYRLTIIFSSNVNKLFYKKLLKNDISMW